MIAAPASRSSGEPRREHGQALTEFVVVAVFVLIPLFLMIPVLAGLISQKQDVELAARYAAWERTVWNQNAPPGPGGGATVKSDTRVAREVDARILASDMQPIVSADDVEYTLDPFAFRFDTGEALIEEGPAANNTAQSEYAQQTATEAQPGGVAGIFNLVFGELGDITRFDLNQNGLYTATVTVQIADLSPLFNLNPEFNLTALDMSGLQLNRSNVLFTEAWTGGNKNQVANLVSGLLPQQFLDNGVMETVQSALATVPVTEELDDDSLIFGYVDIDPLPSYRLGPAAP